ncbi:hypothetical protein HRbin15_00042 [bacterium HR15]|nr:hypothetical protein HRbin15_00042 [bacterium HR15]
MQEHYEPKQIEPKWQQRWREAKLFRTERVNHRFLNILCKQFLIWRTLPQQQHERYLKEELMGV